MIKAAIIEDEQNCSEYLSLLLSKNFEDIEIIGIADSIETGLVLLERETPDLVFLDIMLSNNNAFELLRNFNEIKFEIIFTTAHDEFALKALKVSALDYLLKPIDPKELAVAVEKYKKKHNNPFDFSRQLSVLFDRYVNQNDRPTKIALPTMQGYEIINTEDLIYCEADGGYTKFHLKENQVKLVSKNIKIYEDLLSVSNFFRIHQSFLININHIVKYIKGDASQVIMSNGVSLNVSKLKKDEIKNIIKNFAS
ncbi:MAG TPA: DNA-binding response regulator [Bacteroidales bacterium]|nr:DNA-binding response regulator [Bacteroidales bacterium]